MILGKHYQNWQKTLDAFSTFAGMVENLSDNDKNEFERITGFNATNLLEMYSELSNTVGSQELMQLYTKLADLVDALEASSAPTQDIFEHITGLKLDAAYDAKYSLGQELSR